MTDSEGVPGRTLEPRYFTSDEVFARETERIFAQRWLYAGRAEQVDAPGRYFLFEAGDESVIVVRDSDGVVRAFHNHCRHRGTCLLTDARGEIARHITCPYHSWSYALDGELVGAPNMRETPGFVAQEHSLLEVAMRVWEGAVFICFAEEPQPFDEIFAPVLERFRPWGLEALRVAHREVYDVASNWKLITHNFSECYHCPTVHPFLNELSPYRDTDNDLETGPFLGGPMRMARAGGSMTASGERCADPLPGVEGDDLRNVYYYLMFPNHLLGLHPDFVLSFRLDRVAPARSRVICEWLFHPSAIEREEFDPKDAIDFWNDTNRQDWRICELTQRGVSSRASRQGRYSSLESLLPLIDREYLRSMGDDG
jgi:Rieske 2Fe-2S family protein